MNINLENNERLFLLKYVNFSLQKCTWKNATIKKWKMLYSIQAKLEKNKIGERNDKRHE